MQSRRWPRGEVWFVLAAVVATLALTPATVDAQSSGAAAIIAAVRAKITPVSKETDVPARFATALGFTPKGATWGYVQGGVTDAGGVIHTIGDDPASGDVLIVRRQPELLMAFNARRDGALVGAISYAVTANILTKRTTHDAKPDYDAELAWWASWLKTAPK
jgi:hypothetical protein